MAPGACGGGVGAAVLATTSASPAAPASPVACSENADFANFYRYFSVHEVPKPGLAPTFTPWGHHMPHTPVQKWSQAPHLGALWKIYQKDAEPQNLLKVANNK